MSLSKLTRPNTSTPAAVEPDAVDDVVPTSQELSLLPENSGAVTMADVLNSALSNESSRADNRFAVVNLSGGPSGGMFCPADFLPQEVQDALPSGKKPITGVLLGYRLAVSAWPVGYTDAPTDKNAPKSKPVYAASVSANDSAVMPLALKAARNYQFTKSADKAKFDYAVSSAGHIRAAVELLVYEASQGQPIVISSPANFGCVEATLLNIQRLIDPSTGSLTQFPCSVRPVSEEKSSKGGFTWKQHSLDISNTAGQAQSAQDWKSFGAWKVEAMKDPATVQGVRDWLSAQDRKVTADVVAALKAAASL